MPAAASLGLLAVVSREYDEVDGAVDDDDDDDDDDVDDDDEW